jgi:hypothetical protein
MGYEALLFLSITIDNSCKYPFRHDKDEQTFDIIELSHCIDFGTMLGLFLIFKVNWLKGHFVFVGLKECLAIVRGDNVLAYLNL